MKTIKKLQISLMILLLIFSASCSLDYDEMNVNPNAATRVPGTNVLGRALISSSEILYGERLGIYYTATWAGHTVAIGVGDYEYRIDINNSQWQAMYLSMEYCNDVMNIALMEENDNLYAAALALKALMAHKTTDMWGRIPYSEAFKLDEGVLYPKYDTEPELYSQILAELKTASEMITVGGKSTGVGDFLFKGNIDKWKKLINSTRLRVAIRMSSADPSTASSILAEILNSPSQFPVITSNSDNAYFWWPGVATSERDPWFRRLGVAAGAQKTDAYRTNNILISNLKNLNDPRLPVYADPNKWGVFNGYKMGPGQTSDTLNNGNNVSHIGNRFGQNPSGFSPFMNAAEVYFIMAEAYARNLVSGGNAKAAYELGVTRSLEENGVSAANIAAYLAQPSVAWDGGTMSNLEKIYLQKWLSLFKNSVEAWAEVRRTDVPKITEVAQDYAGQHNRPPFRMGYPDSEKFLNVNFPTDIVEEDIFYGTQLWWDKRTGVN